MSRLLVCDSGVGGLSVVQAIRRRLPEASITYLADRAGFPYGDWPAEKLADRVDRLVGRAVQTVEVDAVILACNTATTVALDRVRARHDLPIVGTVPGIKPAAAITETGVIGLAATAGTIGRAYTAELVRRFAADVTVVPVGCRHLARMAEDHLQGMPVARQAIADELAPLFDRPDPPVDTVVLGCTHYPLLLDQLRAAARRPIHWIDTGPAIAEQVARVAPAAPDTVLKSAPALITGSDISADDRAIFRRFGFGHCQTLSLPA